MIKWRRLGGRHDDLVQLLRPRPEVDCGRRPEPAHIPCRLSDVAITVASMKPQANALALIVSDIAASVDFYRRLGLDFGDVTSAHIECELMPGFKLMLDDAANAKVFYPDWTRPTGGAHTALAFEFGSPSEVDEIYRELADVG